MAVFQVPCRTPTLSLRPTLTRPFSGAIPGPIYQPVHNLTHIRHTSVGRTHGAATIQLVEALPHVLCETRAMVQLQTP